jgi:hypothetical protein
MSLFVFVTLLELLELLESPSSLSETCFDGGNDIMRTTHFS